MTKVAGRAPSQPGRQQWQKSAKSDGSSVLRGHEESMTYSADYSLLCLDGACPVVHEQPLARDSLCRPDRSRCAAPHRGDRFPSAALTSQSFFEPIGH